MPTITLEIPETVRQGLQAEAERQETSVEAVAVRRLADAYGRPRELEPITDMVAFIREARKGARFHSGEEVRQHVEELRSEWD